MAVEVRLMSNLNVVRLFQRKESQFIAAKHDVTKQAWKKMAVEKKFDVQMLNNTRASIVGWSDDSQSLLLKLSAMPPGEEDPIEYDVAIQLGEN